MIDTLIDRVMKHLRAGERPESQKDLQRIMGIDRPNHASQT